MKKSDNYNKYSDGEIFIKCVFEKLGMVDITHENLIIQHDKYVPDFIFEFEGKRYCVEVKIKFSNNVLGIILENFYKFINTKNISGILVILDKVPSKYKKIVKEKYNICIYDISNILYLIYDDEDLQRKLSGLISFSLDNVIPEETSIKLQSNKIKRIVKNKKKNYIEELNNIKEGRTDSKRYEKLLEEIIKKIFSNELALFQHQRRTEDGINIFDMICKIKNGINDDFFTIVEKYYKTKYILFEFKNYSDVIKQGQICTTEKYLFETALRKVAIIITRHGIDKNGMKLAKGILRESGKLIIVLNDEDVKEMIRIYENGEKATTVLERKLDELLTTLEK